LLSECWDCTHSTLRENLGYVANWMAVPRPSWPFCSISTSSNAQQGLENTTRCRIQMASVHSTKAVLLALATTQEIIKDLRKSAIQHRSSLLVMIQATVVHLIKHFFRISNRLEQLYLQRWICFLAELLIFRSVERHMLSDMSWMSNEAWQCEAGFTFPVHCWRAVCISILCRLVDVRCCKTLYLQ
jgi:hypothetical protein